jgi:hypothetical protein
MLRKANPVLLMAMSILVTVLLGCEKEAGDTGSTTVGYDESDCKGDGA